MLATGAHTDGPPRESFPQRKKAARWLDGRAPQPAILLAPGRLAVDGNQGGGARERDDRMARRTIRGSPGHVTEIRGNTGAATQWTRCRLNRTAIGAAL